MTITKATPINVATKPGLILLNVGLAVGAKDLHLTVSDVLRAIESHLRADHVRQYLFHNENEHGVAVSCKSLYAGAALEHSIESLADALKQDCIAWIDSSHHGYLSGSNLAPYGGEFDPRYFIIG